MKRILGKIRYIIIFFVTLLSAFTALFFVNTYVKIYIGEVLIKSGFESDFTDYITYYASEEYEKEESTQPQTEIESSFQEQDMWQQMYPFKETSFIEDYCVSQSLKKPNEEKELTVIDKIDYFAEKYFFGYKLVKEKYFSEENTEESESFATNPNNKYFSIVTMDDGFLNEFKPKGDMREKALSVKALSEYCNKVGCEFLYIQEPYKTDKYNDTDISGIRDFSNQNQDELIELLKANDVSVLDFREIIHAAGLTRQDIFYRTDHHWLAETGFWASDKILEYLKENYNFNVDTEIIDESNFDKKVYKDYFLGSQGKKISLENTKPDDFSLYYPRFETKLKVEIPQVNINRTGDMTLLYNMYSVSTCDYYGKNPYATYSYGDQPLMHITNELITDDDTKILLLHDSFCDCVIPFISLGIKNVNALDLRHFTGSVETYIDTEKPDIVIVASSVSIGGKISWEKHNSSFDFR